MIEMKFNEEKDYFILYSNCISVKGASRSLIMDLQKNEYHYMPNDLYNILSISRQYPLKNIYNKFAKSEYETLDNYYNFLIRNDLGFKVNDVGLFPEISSYFKYPSIISNVIIDIDFNSPEFEVIEKALMEFSNLGCLALQLRFYSKGNENLIQEYIDFVNKSRIKELFIMLPYDENIENYFMENAIKNNSRLVEVNFYGKLKENSSYLGCEILYSGFKKFSETSCGKICRTNFAINLNHYAESKNYNSCLNKKMAIDRNGFIKNCPSQVFDYGHISNTLISEVAKSKEFTGKYELIKDEIDICKDCEYRYICTDCRIHHSKAELNYSKPEKCNYDPYTVTWS